MARPESHALHHERGVHRHNYADLPVFDMLFGTFRNPERFPAEVAFDVAPTVPELLLCLDPEAAQAPSPQRQAHQR